VGKSLNRLKHAEKLYRPFRRSSLTDGAPPVPMALPVMNYSIAESFFRRFIGMFVEEMEIDFLFSRMVNV
jgi:hypothetical protein